MADNLTVSLQVLRDVAKEHGIDPDAAEQAARASAAAGDGDVAMACDLLASDIIGDSWTPSDLPVPPS